MTSKGFAENTNNIETPNDINVTEKPLNPNKISSGRVDINVLKSKLQETESREFKKNLIILILLFTMLGVLGINLSF